MSHKILKIDNLDLDLQGQVGIQTSNIFILTVKHEPLQILPSNLNCLPSMLMSQTGLKTGDLDLDLRGQIGLET